MQYILSETEYAALQSRIAELESVNNNLVTDLLKAGHKLDVADKVREDDRAQLNDLTHTCRHLDKALTEAKRDMDGMEKKVSDLSDQLAYFRNLASDRYDALVETAQERDALQERLDKAEVLSQRRLRLANELQTAIQRVKRDLVACVVNPKTGTRRIVSVAKLDTYAKFGWEVYCEPMLVDRPVSLA